VSKIQLPLGIERLQVEIDSRVALDTGKGTAYPSSLASALDRG